MKSRRTESRERPLERAALVGLVTRAARRADPDTILDELEGLARADGAEVVLRAVQDRPSPDPATLIGQGKADTLALACAETGADLVIFDNELTPAQGRNLEKVFGRRVIDRTELILDIFAKRARTREGRLQVELAQLQYRLPRLAGSSDALSRLGGGIGTRGPGETKLETDRRRIRDRIASLKREIADVGRRRSYLRDRRRRGDVPTVALVGYTNAGKTTLFNALTGAQAVASHALFVTLDPLVRRLKLGDAGQILLSDTVGFIDRLPHQLVAAFRATLEEVAAADLLIHVVDAASPDRDRHLTAVRNVLADVGAAAVPTIEAWNKIDLVDADERARLETSPHGEVLISARRRDGLDALARAIAAHLSMDTARVRFDLNLRRDADRKTVAELYKMARVVAHVADGDRVAIDADVPRRLLGRFPRAKVPA
ncbi:MAG TPA: GTPase HflX [Vicinamibacterales bacterium]|nr:GTPase HflX [Vicinamibacterales bacterium]